MVGVDIGLGEFKRMKGIDRDAVLFTNQQRILKKFGDYKFNKRLVYVWLFVLTVALGFRKFLPI